MNQDHRYSDAEIVGHGRRRLAAGPLRWWTY